MDGKHSPQLKIPRHTPVAQIPGILLVKINLDILSKEKFNIARLMTRVNKLVDDQLVKIIQLHNIGEGKLKPENLAQWDTYEIREVVIQWLFEFSLPKERRIIILQ